VLDYEHKNPILPLTIPPGPLQKKGEKKGGKSALPVSKMDVSGLLDKFTI
jgi:hypothetical protein